MGDEFTELTEAQAIGAELNDEAIRITGLAESLCFVAGETVVTGDFKGAQKLSWAYECLAGAANALAQRLREVAP